MHIRTKMCFNRRETSPWPIRHHRPSPSSPEMDADASDPDWSETDGDDIGNEDPAKGVERSGKDYFLLGNKIEAPRIEPALYIVATPIGNLRDMTIRGLETLAACDVIACEDTRVSRKLLTHYGIRSRLVTYHEHNADRQRPYLLETLAAGKSVALISDAGTPLLSDPGYRLVADMLAADHRVVPVPGASAMLSALVGAGLPHRPDPFRRLPAPQGGRAGSQADGSRRRARYAGLL